MSTGPRGRRTRRAAGAPRWRDLAELVRLPAALTVPGDTLAGAAAAGWPLGRRTYALPLASACLYWAGMALNDYADRELDAVERPERPIPSGRVRPGEALALAVGLTTAGVAVAGAVGGRRSAGTATALAAAVWSYDLFLKATPLGPPGMAATRALDVLLGAGPRPRAAALPAAALAVHTLGVTTLSRGEVHGGSRATAGAALAGTAAAALLAAAPAGRTTAVGAAGHPAPGPGAAGRPGRPPVRWATGASARRTASARGPGGSVPVPAPAPRRTAGPGAHREPVRTPASALCGTGHRGDAVAAGAAALLAARFVFAVGRAQARAARDLRAASVRSATGAGIHGMIPLQAALIARTGSLPPAAALLAMTPVVTAASKVVSPT
ncbi:SCO3242 family prenyltransferase [Nocardiopsis mangrovi]|uniref:SCO3242 family prenyltransferase n=1 Tax=Nocardiopsis mangrovi TaxID=1179818 RepID=A0ABV9DYP5_9ACTN